MKEPRITFRAQDPEAPKDLIELARAIINNPETSRARFNKATGMLALANRMLEWQQANPDKVKIPDLNRLTQNQAA